MLPQLPLCFRIDPATLPIRPKRKFDMLVLIGLAKLLKAAVLCALALGIFRLMKGDMAENITRTLEHLRVDPDSHFAHRLIAKLTGIPHKRLKMVELGTFLYAALYAVEGTGLILKKHWAEWMTTIGTALFLPLEGYELFHRFGWLKVLVLLLNLAIVAYLIYRLRAQKKARDAEAAGATNELSAGGSAARSAEAPAASSPADAPPATGPRRDGPAPTT
jgi:uncharacterized membrane protein (DUF2068 family)